METNNNGNDCKKFVICLDWDGVISDTKKLLEEQIKKIDYNATVEHINELNAKFSSDNISDFQYVDEARDLRDRILEEVDFEYKNRINYSLIYTIQNAFNKAIENIIALANSDFVEKVIIISHTNTKNEEDAKQAFFNQYLNKAPNISLEMLRFHDEKYDPSRKRARQSKARYLIDKFNISKEDFKRYVLIDDTSSICEEWHNEGGIYIPFEAGSHEIDTKLGDLAPGKIRAFLEQLSSYMKLSYIKEIFNGIKGAFNSYNNGSGCQLVYNNIY